MLFVHFRAPFLPSSSIQEGTYELVSTREKKSRTRHKKKVTEWVLLGTEQDGRCVEESPLYLYARRVSPSEEGSVVSKRLRFTLSFRRERVVYLLHSSLRKEVGEHVVGSVVSPGHFVDVLLLRLCDVNPSCSHFRSGLWQIPRCILSPFSRDYDDEEEEESFFHSLMTLQTVELLRLCFLHDSDTFKQLTSIARSGHRCTNLILIHTRLLRLCDPEMVGACAKMATALYYDWRKCTRKYPTFWSTVHGAVHLNGFLSDEEESLFRFYALYTGLMQKLPHEAFEGRTVESVLLEQKATCFYSKLLRLQCCFEISLRPCSIDLLVRCIMIVCEDTLCEELDLVSRSSHHRYLFCSILFFCLTRLAKRTPSPEGSRIPSILLAKTVCVLLSYPCDRCRACLLDCDTLIDKCSFLTTPLSFERKDSCPSSGKEGDDSGAKYRIVFPYGGVSRRSIPCPLSSSFLSPRALVSVTDCCAV